MSKSSSSLSDLDTHRWSLGQGRSGGGQDHREEGPKGSQPKGVGQAGQGLGYSHSRKNKWRDIRKDLCDICIKKKLDRTTETPPSPSKNAQKKTGSLWCQRQEAGQHDPQRALKPQNWHVEGAEAQLGLMES